MANNQNDGVVRTVDFRNPGKERERLARKPRRQPTPAAQAPASDDYEAFSEPLTAQEIAQLAVQNGPAASGDELSTRRDIASFLAIEGIKALRAAHGAIFVSIALCDHDRSGKVPPAPGNDWFTSLRCVLQSAGEGGPFLTVAIREACLEERGRHGRFYTLVTHEIAETGTPILRRIGGDGRVLLVAPSGTCIESAHTIYELSTHPSLRQT